MNRFSKNSFNKVLFLFLAFVIFAFGFALGKSHYEINDSKKYLNSSNGQEVDLSLYFEARQKLFEKSIFNLNDQKLLYGSISGMLEAAGDPYTVFLSKDDMKRFMEDISGEFGGIGIELISKNGLPTIVSPLPGTPAEIAGLKAGDIIIEVDGVETEDLGFLATVDKIRGEKGSNVSLKVYRQGVSEPISYEVIRDNIVVESVSWEYQQRNDQKYAYVKVSQFGEDTDKLFKRFADDVKKKKPAGIIIDLRNNPGGYLETAVDLVSYFVNDGVAVIEKNKAGETKEYKVRKKDDLSNFRVAILANGGSASASEIFVGALSDYKIAKIIGEKTFGKGSVQELVPLTDGSAVKITVAKWLTPKGREIDSVAIKPDLEVVPNDQTELDEQLEAAFSYLENL